MGHLATIATFAIGNAIRVEGQHAELQRCRNGKTSETFIIGCLGNSVAKNEVTRLRHRESRDRVLLELSHLCMVQPASRLRLITCERQLPLPLRLLLPLSTIPPR